MGKRKLSRTTIQEADLSNKLQKGLHLEAAQAGFDVLGMVRVDDLPDQGEALAKFVEAGRHGDMDWLKEHVERRRHPTGLWPQVRSVIMLGMNYGSEKSPLAALQERSNGVISFKREKRLFCKEILQGTP